MTRNFLIKYANKKGFIFDGYKHNNDWYKAINKKGVVCKSFTLEGLKRMIDKYLCDEVREKINNINIGDNIKIKSYKDKNMYNGTLTKKEENIIIIDNLYIYYYIDIEYIEKI